MSNNEIKGLRQDIAEFRQFFTVQLLETEARLGQRIDKLDFKIETLRSEMRDGFAGVGEAISEINDRTDRQYRQTDARLKRLEKVNRLKTVID
jgi:hypothetical protein